LFPNKELLEKLGKAPPEEVAEHFFDRVKSPEAKGGFPTGKPAEISSGLVER
jgi:hypothetical protein